MTKRSVSPQAQSESNKRQREEQATDGTNASNNELTQASVKDQTKHGLMDIETQSPGTIKSMAEAACEERAEALNDIAATLGKLDKDELLSIEATKPGFIYAIAEAATSGHPAALNDIAATLGLLSKDDLLDIETNDPGTIFEIAQAAREGHPTALNNIADTLGLLSNYELNKIEAEDGGTIECIAEAATSGHPTALNSIASTISQLDISILDHNTIETIQKAACDGYPKAFYSIAATLGKLNKNDFIANVASQPSIIFKIAEAGVNGYPTALDIIADALGRLSKDELIAIETNSQSTIYMIAAAAREGHPTALNNIADTLGLLSNNELNKIEARDGDTIECIAEAAVEGYPAALLALLKHFFIYDNNKLKLNLPKYIIDSIDKGEYGKCLGTVAVAAEIQKNIPPLCYSFTYEFKKTAKWYSTITALETYDNIIEYIIKTLLVRYDDQDISQWAIKFLSKLIEYYDESIPCPIECDRSDRYVFLEKLERFKSQYENVIHPEKRSTIRKYNTFMMPLNKDVIAENSLFSRDDMPLRCKYIKLKEINENAGGLLQLEQCQTLSDAHNEIVILFRHFMLNLQDSLSPSQLTFCYDDIDNLLRLYDFDKASQILSEHCRNKQDEPANHVDGPEFCP